MEAVDAADWNFPGGQVAAGLQAALPEASWNVSATQTGQAVLPVAPWYVPMAQGAQVVVVLLPSFRAVPTGHAAQILFAEAVGAVDWNCPGAQVAAGLQALPSFE